MPRLALRPVHACFVLAWGAAWPVAALTPVPAAGAVNVRFELNDAQVKDQVLPGVQVRVAAVAGGVEVATGVTGADGRFSVALLQGPTGSPTRCPATSRTPAAPPRSATRDSSSR